MSTIEDENKDSVKQNSNNCKKEEKLSVDYDKEIEKLKNSLLLALADNENLRKRFDKEKEDLIKYSVSKFAKGILQVVDNIERALNTIPDSEEFKTVKEGIKITEKELLSILEKNNIKKINLSIGDTFDPHFHQAMLEETNDELDSGTVGKILQNGFTLHDRVLRPTLVSVVKKSEK